MLLCIAIIAKYLPENRLSKQRSHYLIILSFTLNYTSPLLKVKDFTRIFTKISIKQNNIHHFTGTQTRKPAVIAGTFSSW